MLQCVLEVFRACSVLDRRPSSFNSTYKPSFCGTEVVLGAYHEQRLEATASSKVIIVSFRKSLMKLLNCLTISIDGMYIFKMHLQWHR
jgi:hypothetical protein